LLSMSPITPEVEKAKKAVLLKYIGYAAVAVVIVGGLACGPGYVIAQEVFKFVRSQSATRTAATLVGTATLHAIVGKIHTENDKK